MTVAKAINKGQQTNSVSMKTLSAYLARNLSDVKIRSNLRGITLAFSESELAAQLATDGLVAEITKFVPVGATHTDVFVQNLNTTTSRKAGWTQVAQTNTAAEAAALIRDNLTA